MRPSRYAPVGVAANHSIQAEARLEVAGLRGPT